MRSKTVIKSRLKRKTNQEIVDTILLGTKNPRWMKIAQIVSNSTRKYASINLSDIEKETKIGDTILIPGKILSSGKLSKKVRICALSISSHALDKLKETKSEFFTILEEMKKNPKAEGIKLLQ